MIYVFDSNALIDLFRHYYELRFPTLWINFNGLVSDRRILSVREAKNELTSYYKTDRLEGWVSSNSQIFEVPEDEEISIIQAIFQINHFQSNISLQSLLQGKAVADPFVIAKAKILSGIVVTQEELKPHASKIPNICEYLEIPCINLEGFMEKENWIF